MSFKDSRSYFRSKDIKSTQPLPNKANIELDSDEDEYLVEAPTSEKPNTLSYRITYILEEEDLS